MSRENRNSLRPLMLCCTLTYSLMALFPASATLLAPADHTAPATILPNEITPYYPLELTVLYASHQMQPMWQDRTAVQQFQQQLIEVAMSGIHPQFIQWVKWLGDQTITDMARDVVLSDAMLGYLHFVSGIESNGKMWLYGRTPYRLAIPPTIAVKRWQQAVYAGNTAAYLASLAPQHPQYVKMHQALRTMLADHRPWPTLSQPLRPGQRSDSIPALREILVRTGMLTASSATKRLNTLRADHSEGEWAAIDDGRGSEEGITPAFLEQSPTDTVVMDNRYSEELVAGVKRFQRWQGLADDGVLGTRTREWLNVSPLMRAKLLALNIQRLRILPQYIDTAIMVNIPNYSLSYYRNGIEVLSSRVIVGRPSRKTPLMSSALDSVVVNPPWNAPPTLAQRDLVPKIIRDPDYLQRHGYTLLSSWGGNAAAIDPASIDWSSVSSRNFPYRIRQAPGKSNSLGRYKFNMPTTNAIYLHDTPNRKLFKKAIRALSSGCIRVSKASDLADILLQDAGWNSARVSSTLQRGNTTYVNIRRPIPVQLYYLTAWIADDGQPQFRTDIYNYDGAAKSGGQILSQAKFLLQ